MRRTIARPPSDASTRSERSAADGWTGGNGHHDRRGAASRCRHRRPEGTPRRSSRWQRVDHVGPIHPEIARRWACDASVSRVITNGSSEPLDIGRRTSTVPGPMRRAVTVRTCTAGSPAATARRRGATRTMSSIGPTAEPLRFRTSCCCAGAIIGSSTNLVVSGWKSRMAGRFLQAGRLGVGGATPPSDEAAAAFGSPVRRARRRSDTGQFSMTVLRRISYRCQAVGLGPNVLGS